MVPNTGPVPEWGESEYLVQNDFESKAARRIELKELQEAIHRELEELNLEIGAMLATADVKSVKFGNYRISSGFSWKGGKLSKTRLLEVGVTADQIKAATSPKTPGDPYVTVTALTPGEQGVEDVEGEEVA